MIADHAGHLKAPRQIQVRSFAFQPLDARRLAAKRLPSPRRQNLSCSGTGELQALHSGSGMAHLYSSEFA